MITILTPTYNRAYLLPTLYKSLLKQTSKKFEWIIIDDESTDNTEELVASWITSTPSFTIQYCYQKNGGKHRAINRGVKAANYSYCFIVDSDDFIIESAVEKIIEWTRIIDKDPSFAGVAGLKGYISGGTVGRYPLDKKFENYIDANNLERDKLKLTGDKAEVYRTEILRKYPFPEFKGENFLTEGVVWDAIARDGYKIRWFNEVIYRFEYIEDGLTKKGINKLVENFQGYTCYIQQYIVLQSGIVRQLMMGKYLSVAKKKGISISKSAENLNVKPHILLFAYIIWFLNELSKPLRNFFMKRFGNILA